MILKNLLEKEKNITNQPRSPLQHTTPHKKYGGPEGTSLYNFSLHYINFDLCEKILRDYVYIIILHV